MEIKLLTEVRKIKSMMGLLMEGQSPQFFYRSETITNVDRLNTICNSKGKSYPIYRELGKPEYLGTYVGTDGEKLIPFMKGDAGQKTSGVGAIVQMNVSEIDGIDEYVFCATVLNWFDVRDPESQKILIDFFGDGIKKYFKQIEQYQSKFFTKETENIREKQRNQLRNRQSGKVAPGENKYMDTGCNTLKPLLEIIRKDKEVLNYFLSHKPEYMEHNFRIKPNGSGTTVVGFTLYDTKSGEKIDCDKAIEILGGKSQEEK